MGRIVRRAGQRRGRRRGNLAAIVVLGLVGLAAAGGCSRSSREAPIAPDETKPGHHGSWLSVPPASPPLNLIIFTLDTTRRNHLSCYGYGKGTTPNLDRIASEGILFENGTTPCPVTLAAHSSIMTGEYPYQHGVRNNGTYVLPDRAVTLAEVLKSRGYDTGAILGGFPVDHRFGLAQGFDHYDDQFPATSVRRRSDTAQRPAADVTRLALEWLDGRQGRPFFLWLHYFDPHAPYTPPEPYKTRYADAPYDGEIASMDASIGEMVAGLESRGLLEKTALLLVGDHGESLGDHGESTHSIFIYGATLRVPFILRLPHQGLFADGSWHGKRVPALVNLVDCFPTALNILGVTDSERPPVAGISLLPVIQGQDPGHRWIYCETLVPKLEYTWSDLRGLETARWKYIRAPRPELYDLSKDPEEARNLASREPKLVRAMEADLGTVLASDVGGETGQVAMDQETIEKLRSLGYLAGAATTKSAGAARDPKDMIRTYELVNLARSRASEHQPLEALALCDSVFKTDAADETARRIRAICLIRVGRGAQAVGAYDTLLADCGDCPDRLDLEKGWVSAAVSAGRATEAEARVRSLIGAHPEADGLHLLLGQVLAAEKRPDDAVRAMEDEARLFPTDATPLVSIGDLRWASGDRARAEEAYRKALAVNPQSADALAKLAELLFASGKNEESRRLVDQALQNDPTDPTALFRKAWFQRQDGLNAEAAANFRAVVARDPTNVAALYNLGKIDSEQNRFDEALRLFQQAIRVGPATQDIYVNLGVVQAQMGNLSAAVESWQKAIDLDPKSPNVAGIQRNIAMARSRMAAGTQ